MTQAKGAKAQLLLDFESTYGVTPGSPAAINMPINKSSVISKQNLIEPGTITGRRDPVEPSRGNIDDTGNIVAPIDIRNFGYWLKAAFDDPETTEVSSRGTLTGATGVTTTIGTWTAVTTGGFKVSIDGSGVTEVSPIDFSSGVTTMANVASKIQTAIRAIGTGGFTNAIVTWDTTNTRFVIQSGTTGALSTISQLTAPSSGTDISGSSFMKCTAGTITAGEALYQHVFKVGDTMPSLVLEQGFTDINTYALHNGCMIGKIGMSFGGDGELTASIDVLGMKETISATSFDGTPTTLVLGRFNNFQAAVQEGGSTIAICRKVDINLDFGLDGDSYCIGGGGFRREATPGIIGVSGTVEALFENQTLLNKSINGTESSIKLTLTNGTNSLEFFIPELTYERNTPGIEGPKGVIISLPYRGYYGNGADNSVIKVTLINGVSTY
jgi:hypothetical protein